MTTSQKTLLTLAHLADALSLTPHCRKRSHGTCTLLGSSPKTPPDGTGGTASPESLGRRWGRIANGPPRVRAIGQPRDLPLVGRPESAGGALVIEA